MTLEQAFAYIRQHTDADDFTFEAGVSDVLETRFAQNAITQHMNGVQSEYTLEVAYGNRTGIASVNQLNEESVDWLLQTAQDIARMNQPDPEYMPSESAQELPASADYDEATASYPMEKMVDGILACVHNAEGLDAKVSGLSTRATRSSSTFTAHGFEGHNRETEFTHSMTMKKGDVETKVSLGVKRVADFDMAALIARLNGQFASLKDLSPSHAGRQTVILRPQAVANLFAMLGWYMNRRDADEGTSPYSDQLGKQLFGPAFSMLSTRDDPELVAPAYTWLQRPAASVEWVRDGVLRNLPTDRYWASQKGIEPVNRFNLLIPGGTATEEEMMRQAGSGLIVNNMWYIRSVDQKRGEFTGMTRDGVMRFENGKIVGAVHNLRWNEIPHELTRRILALGPAQLIDAGNKVPTMLVEDFNFVDTTTF